MSATQTSVGSRPAQGARLALGLLIAVFVLASLPSLIWPLNPHPDERRYTIAAAQMMATGDYLIPRAEDGAIRLKKPPLTYYYVVAGFAALGQTLAGAKLLFVSSAAAILALSYVLARALGASAPVAVFATALMAGHRVFFSTASQHIPDMPLILGTTVALIGVVRLLRGDRPPVWTYYAVYLGIAVAILAKGMLALLLLVLALSWRAGLSLRGWGHAGPSRHDAFAGLLALGLAAVWFVVVWQRYPDEMVAQFFGDQVTDKAAFDVGMVLAGVAKNTGDMVLPLLPGVAGLSIALWRGRAVRTPFSATPAVLFLLVWCALNIVLFAFSSQLYERYTLPAAPALAALMALAAGRVPQAVLQDGLRRGARLFLWLPGLGFALAALVAWRFGGPAWGAGTLLAGGGAVALAWLVSGRRLFGAMLGVALVFPLLDLARLPIFATVLSPTVGPLVARIEGAAGRGAARPRLVLDDAKLVDEIGLRTGGLARFRYAKHFDPSRDTDAETVVFLSESHLDGLRGAGFAVERAFLLRDLDLSLAEIVAALRSGDRAALAVGHGTPVFVATRAAEVRG